MEKITDWVALWRELVLVRSSREAIAPAAEAGADHWRDRARGFEEHVKRRWAKPDTSREYVSSQLDANASVLDIGAGTGAWAGFLAHRARQVTAVEPSAAMIEIMRENLAAEGIDNVAIIQGKWPDVSIEPHDFSLCAHAMYGVPDLPGFIRAMIESTRQMCFLLLRSPSPDDVMAEAALHIWGQPHDSPNFTIAYNILLQMGIHANVLMERDLWNSKSSEDLQSALGEIKRHLGLVENREHDEYLADLLRRRLVWQDGLYVWPRSVRSALVYWKPNP